MGPKLPSKIPDFEQYAGKKAFSALLGLLWFFMSTLGGSTLYLFAANGSVPLDGVGLLFALIFTYMLVMYEEECLKNGQKSLIGGIKKAIENANDYDSG